MLKCTNIKCILLLIMSLVLNGCDHFTPKLSVAVASTRNEAIKTVALAPNSGILGDAIGVELIKYGFEIYDTAHVSSMMIRMNLDEVEILEPQNLKKLKSKGIDSMLQIRTVASYDDRPQSASIKMVSTSTGKIVAGASWQNGSKNSRVDIVTASQQIAKGLSDAIGNKVQR